MNTPFSHAESKAESYSRPRVDIFQYEGPTYVDLHWNGGRASGADLVCAIIEGCHLSNIALVVNHSAAGDDRVATLGADGSEVMAEIRRCVAAKGERAA